MKQLFKYKFQLLIVVSSALVLVLSLLSVFTEANETKELEMYYPAPKYKLEIQSANSRQIEVCEAILRKTLDEVKNEALICKKIFPIDILHKPFYRVGLLHLLFFFD